MIAALVGGILLLRVAQNYHFPESADLWVGSWYWVHQPPWEVGAVARWAVVGHYPQSWKSSHCALLLPHPLRMNREDLGTKMNVEEGVHHQLSHLQELRFLVRHLVLLRDRDEMAALFHRSRVLLFRQMAVLFRHLQHLALLYSYRWLQSYWPKNCYVECFLLLKDETQHYLHPDCSLMM